MGSGSGTRQGKPRALWRVVEGGRWLWREQARCVIRDLVFQGYRAHLLLSTSEK